MTWREYSFNLRGGPELIDDLAADHLLADRAFDADWLRTTLPERSIAPVIPPRSNRHFLRNRPNPFAERRKPDPQIGRNLTPRQATGKHNANRIPLELEARVSLPYPVSLMESIALTRPERNRDRSRDTAVQVSLTPELHAIARPA